MLDKTYDPADVESRHYARWEEGGLFRPRPSRRGRFCVMMPPPNVTGSLHMGHALDNTVQDTLTRFHRMRGYESLWQPGTDHAGIATQMMVERELAKEGLGRRDLGRERFLERVWAWRERSGGMIQNQLRRLGASPDWTRERFTMDEGLSRAVLTAFVSLYKQGLIYRDKRLVNWDCQLQTAISDLEVVQQEVDGKLHYIRYPIEGPNGGEDGRHIVVATVRPETMLGDTGIAVHPDDPRYADLVGRFAILPLVGRRLPIVADAYSDPEKGSGAVKITPAHDYNDFEVGRRHDLEPINILLPDGRLSDDVPPPYRGLDRFEARRRIVRDLEDAGLIEKVEDYRHTVPHGDRSGQPVEPYLTDQWFCDAKTLARPAIAAVEDGRTRFVPQLWENVFFEWMRNIQPWCISRQLWWGHQIPAWYGPDGTVFVELDEATARGAARAHYGREVALERDPDVLDTWFSSGLWPFSTLGWPERTPELERFYPGTVLVTAYDIIFFWVARMMMMGLHFMGDVPFRDVFIHGLIRDEQGQKMSKTKGNVVDPLELIETYGADALRFTLLASTAQGRDIKLGAGRVEGYRNFMTKLWNAARFTEINECRLDPGFDPAAAQDSVNRWIIGELTRTALEIEQALIAYRFNDAAQGLYHFVWDRFCDWYVELAKPLLASEDGTVAAETRATAAFVLSHILELLHPMAPFVSEELWERLYGSPGGPLMVAPWPELPDSLIDPLASAELDWVIRAISGIRAARTEVRVPAGVRLTLELHEAKGGAPARLRRHAEAFRRLARLEELRDGASPPKGALHVVLEDATLVLPVAGIVDLDQEQARLRKEMARAEAEVAQLERKLANPSFVERAPAAVVEESRTRREEWLQARRKLEQALARIT
jgi:valyl-tRNA synthetase